ncbi:hypothetical protein [Sutcliffiella cohnii]|uniref:Uncharacterized protein n=1 Tax=Sutcliffiella cohnii TaxID=33932 RepID=A0A223KT45_9BACI|nr:hypothetical protein [Sutcliffiella cohnii]AST92661.1 hypothetical protein BC6307_15845 [Sutcliffiella cohnii]MED4016446.1 hypothetical protein [Sutcliffiella cohnii]
MTTTSTTKKSSPFSCFWFIVVDRDGVDRKNNYRVAQLVDYKNKSLEEVAKWFESLFHEYSVIKVGRGTLPANLKEMPYIHY